MCDEILNFEIFIDFMKFLKNSKAVFF